MADQIKTVTDKEQFPMLFKNFFKDKKVHLKTSSGGLLIQFLGYHGDNVAFRIPGVKNVPENVLIFTRHDKTTIYTSLKTLDQDVDTFTFLPLKFQIISVFRNENRNLVEVGENGKNVILITNLISDSDVKSALSIHSKKVDKIREIVLFDLQKQFEKINIVFLDQIKNDTRLKFFSEGNKQIAIYDLNVEPDEKNITQYNHYINEIYSKDVQLTRLNQYVSEVTAPIVCRNFIIYGYLQLNNMTPMREGHLAVAKRFAIVINELMKKHEMFLINKSKFLVSDISKSGIGIVFKDKSLIRLFREESIVSFESIFPTQKKVIMSARVKNINFSNNGMIKVGCKIEGMDDTSQRNFDEYIDKIESK